MESGRLWSIEQSIISSTFCRKWEKELEGYSWSSFDGAGYSVWCAHLQIFQVANAGRKTLQLLTTCQVKLPKIGKISDWTRQGFEVPALVKVECLKHGEMIKRGHQPPPLNVAALSSTNRQHIAFWISLYHWISFQAWKVFLSFVLHSWHTVLVDLLPSTMHRYVCQTHQNLQYYTKAVRLLRGKAELLLRWCMWWRVKATTLLYLVLWSSIVLNLLLR
jgi:hypothetical protein